MLTFPEIVFKVSSVNEHKKTRSLGKESGRQRRYMCLFTSPILRATGLPSWSWEYEREAQIPAHYRRFQDVHLFPLVRPRKPLLLRLFGNHVCICRYIRSHVKRTLAWQAIKDTQKISIKEKVSDISENPLTFQSPLDTLVAVEC